MISDRKAWAATLHRDRKVRAYVESHDLSLDDAEAVLQLIQESKEISFKELARKAKPYVDSKKVHKLAYLLYIQDRITRPTTQTYRSK